MLGERFSSAAPSLRSRQTVPSTTWCDTDPVQVDDPSVGDEQKAKGPEHAYQIVSVADGRVPGQTSPTMNIVSCLREHAVGVASSSVLLVNEHHRDLVALERRRAHAQHARYLVLILGDIHIHRQPLCHEGVVMYAGAQPRPDAHFLGMLVHETLPHRPISILEESHRASDVRAKLLPGDGVLTVRGPRLRHHSSRPGRETGSASPSS